MLTRAIVSRIRATVREDFDLAARRIYTSQGNPGAAFVQLADGGLVRVELADDLQTELIDELPADARI